MSLNVLTTQEVSDLIIADLEAALSQTIPLFPKAFNRVLAKALGGVFIILYKYVGFIFLQMFVSFASNEETTINGKTFTPLVEHGRANGTGDPGSGARPEYEIDITVTDIAGTPLVMNSGTQFLNENNGVTYLTIGDVTLDSTTVQADIRAAQDPGGGGGVGSIAELNINDIVSFANARADALGDAVVTVENVPPVDVETADAYRRRVIDRTQKQPQGGAYADYEQWGEEAFSEGIINVYVYTGSPGIVEVYSEAVAIIPGSDSEVDGIPTAAQLQAVLDLINADENGLASRRPANALVYSLPITRRGFNVGVIGMIVANQTQAETAIEDALDQYFVSREPFIPGLSILPRLDSITNAAVGGLVEDIVSSLGGTFTSVDLGFTEGPSVQIYSLAQGEKSKLNSVSFS